MDFDDFLLNTGFPIDKIVDTGTISVVNNGNTTGSQYTYQQANLVTHGLPGYGFPVFVRYIWRIGTGSWQNSGSVIPYSYVVNFPGGSSRLGGVRGLVGAGATIDSVAFRTLNGYHGNVTISSTGGVSYSPTSQTFQIRYAIYSMD